MWACLFSEDYAASHREHDCRGEGCPVCFLIQGAENFFRQFKCTALYTGFSVNALVMAVFILHAVVFCVLPLSSVRLKVKMNR